MASVYLYGYGWLLAPSKRSARSAAGREGRSGAAWSAPLKGRQAQRDGDGLVSRSPGGKRSALAAWAEAVDMRGSKEKAPRPQHAGEALNASLHDQLDAGGTIACSCTMTPGSTKTQGCPAPIGTLNTWVNTWRLMWASRPVR